MPRRINLPVMRCDDGCGECCGPVICKPHEYDAVVKYAAKHGIQPVRQGITCPWYQNGRCAVYEARPPVCRMFGHVPGMVCCKGYNVNVAPEVERRFRRENKPDIDTAKFLHDVFPGWRGEPVGRG